VETLFGISIWNLYLECIRALKNYTKKKSLRYKERDESKRAAFLLSIEEISPSDIVYFDESRIDSFVHKEFGWSVHGEKVMGEVIWKAFCTRKLRCWIISQRDPCAFML
jgi:hypothetical protein